MLAEGPLYPAGNVVVGVAHAPSVNADAAIKAVFIMCVPEISP